MISFLFLSDSNAEQVYESCLPFSVFHHDSSVCFYGFDSGIAVFILKVMEHKYLYLTKMMKWSDEYAKSSAPLQPPISTPWFKHILFIIHEMDWTEQKCYISPLQDINPFHFC